MFKELSCSRISRNGTIPMGFCPALVSLGFNVAIAIADPADDAYLAQLRAVGFTWQPDHDAALTGMGQLICDDPRAGVDVRPDCAARPRHVGPAAGHFRAGHGDGGHRAFDLLPQPSVLGSALLSDTAARCCARLHYAFFR